MFTLSTLSKTVTQQKQRIGRGEGSNRGKNSGKGNKGQTKRAGKSPVHWRTGGSGESGNSFLSSTPKWAGFKPAFQKVRKLREFSLSTIEKHFEDNSQISLATLLEKKLITNKIKNVRIIGGLNITKKFTFAEEIYTTSGVKKILA